MLKVSKLAGKNFIQHSYHEAWEAHSWTEFLACSFFAYGNADVHAQITSIRKIFKGFFFPRERISKWVLILDCLIKEEKKKLKEEEE